MFRTNSTKNLLNKLQMNASKLISLEVNPGNTLDLNKLKEMQPTLCSITWHYNIKNYKEHIDVNNIPALNLASQLKKQGFEVILHLATRNLNSANAISILNYVKSIGITNLFIVQGDASKILLEEDSDCDFPYAVSFIKFVKLKYGDYFSIGVAGYPEQTTEESLNILKSKMAAGADYIITQAILDFQQFKSFVHNCEKNEIKIPIIPAMYIFHNLNGLRKFCTLCQIKIPQNLEQVLANCQVNTELERLHCYNFCTKLFVDLLSFNNSVHIFTLNSLKSINMIINTMLKDLK